MSFKLLTEQRLEFLSLKEGCTGSSESTLVKMPHCRKLHVAAHMAKSQLFLCQWLLITFAKSLDPDKAGQNVQKLLDTQMVFLKDFFSKR